MIENELQFRVTMEQAQRFERAIKRLEVEPLSDQEIPEFREAHLQAMRSQAQELRNQLAAWGTSITCPRCGLLSFNPNDVEHKYCGACHRYIWDETV